MSLRRAFMALALATASMVALILPAAAADVSVFPLSGQQGDVFTIVGHGLPPGLPLDVSFKSPAGQIFTVTAARGAIVVDQSGGFKLQVTPSADFAGDRQGIWAVRTCAAGTSDCLQTLFTVSAEAP
jgi:hypothetical protein